MTCRRNRSAMMARSVRPLSCNLSRMCGTPNSSAKAASRAALPAPPLAMSVPSMSNKQTCMKTSLDRGKSRLDARAEDVEEAGQPLRMCRPGGCSDEVAIHVRLLETDIDPASACSLHIGADGGVGRATAALDDAGSNQELCGMADSGNRLLGFGKNDAPCPAPPHGGADTRALGHRGG